MSVRKPKPIKLDVTGPNERQISARFGKMGYLWIGGVGDSGTCYGCVPDRSVKKLRDWCDRILKARAKG